MTEIVYKSRDVLVFNKPVGMPSQSDRSGDKDAMTYCSELLRAMGEREELYLIHRLDRVVGGLMVFARNKRTAANLSSAVANRDFTKEYFAVADGYPEGTEMVDLIYKDPLVNRAFVTDKQVRGAKEARLKYAVLSVKEYDGRTKALVKISLETGRFHQIRAQFAAREMPLIGDKKYGSRDFRVNQPALFAGRLSFELNGKNYSFAVMPDISKYPWSLFDWET